MLLDSKFRYLIKESLSFILNVIDDAKFETKNPDMLKLKIINFNLSLIKKTFYFNFFARLDISI